MAVTWRAWCCASYLCVSRDGSETRVCSADAKFYDERLEADDIVELSEKSVGSENDDIAGGDPEDPVVFVTVLEPLPQCDEEFRSEWDKHAELVREKLNTYTASQSTWKRQSNYTSYQRNPSKNVPVDQANNRLSGKPFPSEFYEQRGGCEEICFGNWKDAEGLMEKYAEKLRES